LKTFTINWTDRVDYKLKVNAKNKEVALKMFNNDEFDLEFKEEENVEYITEPWIDDE